jgi:hypothetical protein
MNLATSILIPMDIQLVLFHILAQPHKHHLYCHDKGVLINLLAPEFF